ncbi:Hemolysin, contains CBS domains [Rhodococcus rhodochrous J3]|uniref:Hemolysin family protein n=2 Tax=Rhodococcus rhodochrous TaxID=1829 RepID=A0AA47A7Q4_RHORH|nr:MULTISPECIES: hemolysin family protein [Rhodococcus]AYA26617.1 HlyC/CorC family transporter [Rhodococcus rhodochrous]MBF4476537.1 HlyC/CorC family transporter [Rhodococcus rhodochrous]MCB8908670.1 hemolysin family protein [Rhodococcus rhodochrous]MCD2098711.1 hemolysin family protein [Rhodococcus rhodochrous]MCD2123195.1 hemolysin family protein [Rhodococcus rhodochrous]
MSDWFGIVLAVLLLAGNAFFVGAEFSLITVRRDRLETLLAQGKTRARTVIHAGEHLSLMLAGSQLGITICSILLGRVAEPAIAHLIEVPLHAARVPDALLHPIAFTIGLTIVVVLHILLGEMVPKNIAIAGPERAAMLLVPIHLWFMRPARPVIAFYNLCANATLRAAHIDPKDELDTSVSAVELTEMIGESRSEGLLDEEEHKRLTRALATGNRTVADVMIPLARVRTVPHTDAGPTLGDVEHAVTTTGFSRYPTRRPDGTITGYIHIKDVLDLVREQSTGPETLIPAAAIRALPTIGIADGLDEALAALRRSNAHLAGVIDTTGTLRGIVALEDLVEEFVGTVRDATHRVADPLGNRPRTTAPRSTEREP